jgi:hypothetical protein
METNIPMILNGPTRKKFGTFKSGEREGQATDSLLCIHWPGNF